MRIERLRGDIVRPASSHVCRVEAASAAASVSPSVSARLVRGARMLAACSGTGRSRSRRSTGTRRRRGREPRCAAGAARHEDQARDAGGHGHEHRDLAERVPGADVDEHHVDDVLAVRLDGERGEPLGDRRLDPGAERDEADDAHHDAGERADDAARDLVHGRVALRDLPGEASQHEHEHHEHDRLDERLREGEVGCARHAEQQHEPVAGDADEEHRGHALAHRGRGDGRDAHDECEERLRRVVPEPDAVGPRGVHDGCRAEAADEHGHDDREVAGQPAVLDRGRDGGGEPVDDRDDAEVAACRVDRARRPPAGGRRAGAPRRAARRGRTRRPTARGRARARARARGGTPGTGQLVGVRGEQRFDERDREGEHDARRREQAGGVAMARRSACSGVGATPAFAEERAPDEAHAVGDREHRADERADERDPRPRLARGRGLEERGEHGLFRDEAEQRGHAGHRPGGDERDRRDDGHPPAEPREPAPVAGARRVVDDADHEEERRLEQRVREQQRDARERGVAGAVAGDDDEEAELADGAVGEEQLEVVLAKGAPAAHEHGEHAEADDDRMPHLGRRSRGRAAPRGRRRPSPSRRRAGRRSPGWARPSRRAARSGTARARSSRSHRRA